MGDQGQEGKRRRGLFGRRRVSEQADPEATAHTSADDALPVPSERSSEPHSAPTSPPVEPSELPPIAAVTSNEHDTGSAEPAAGPASSAIPDGAVVRSTGGTVSPSGHVRLVTIDPAPAPPEVVELPATAPTAVREDPSGTPAASGEVRVDIESPAPEVPAPSAEHPAEPVAPVPEPEQPPTTADDAAPATADVAPEEIESGEDVTATTDPATSAEPGTEEEPGDRADELEPEPFELPAILAVANQKGGVGKTTTAVNLGAALAELGFRVLVVDLDPQGNATTGLGINGRNLETSVYDVIMNDVGIEDCVEPTSLKNLFVVPATIDLAGAEIELVPAFSRELKLRRALDDVRDDYDFTLIDCPPSLGLLTVNGLAAADAVLVPIQCEYYALEGLGQLLRNVALVRSNLNPTLDVGGIVLTMYDARTKLADQVEQEVRDHFGAKVYRSVVPRTVRLSEAPSFGQPIIVFDPTSRGAIAYRELAKEVSRGTARRAG
jgi:chromosome partitioning protein